MDKEDRPNVVLVTVDSLRADHVGCYTRNLRSFTPHLDKLTEDHGFSYLNDTFSQGPFTTFSMPSLFTSRYPSGNHYFKFIDDVVGVRTSDNPTVTEVLRQAGYRTVGFHSNPLLSSMFGFDKGFDIFSQDLPLSGIDAPDKARYVVNKLLRLVRKHPYVPAKEITKRAVNWINKRQEDEPFFLWVHYMDVHGPYQSRDGFSYLNKYRSEKLWQKAVNTPESVSRREHRRLVKSYREEIKYTDKYLGKLIEEIRGKSNRDSIYVVTSDHGEGFNEHGFYSHPHQLYDELIRVPLIIGRDDGEFDLQQKPSGLLDVAPTVLDTLDIETPSGFEGQSLLAKNEGDGTVISEADIFPETTLCIRNRRWKYILNCKEGREMLFDLHEDPGEKTNLRDLETKVKEDLKQKLISHTERPESIDQEVNVNTDFGRYQNIEERLEDLGYL